MVNLVLIARVAGASILHPILCGNKPNVIFCAAVYQAASMKETYEILLLLAGVHHS